ncbi:MAG: hotdog fold thioesterase [Bacteroidota bacterium]|nr:hotdog fold thioesterase [Bacteroidota bacterium]
MSIWFQKNIVIDDLHQLGENTMAEFLGLKWVGIGDDFLKLSMPVNDATRQPYGFLHGGASCVLAETIGSVGSALVIDREKYYCVGLEINANHIKSVSEGIVLAVAKPLHLGKSTHVWDIRIYDDNEKLFCVSRLTVAIIPIKK